MVFFYEDGLFVQKKINDMTIMNTTDKITIQCIGNRRKSKRIDYFKTEMVLLGYTDSSASILSVVYDQIFPWKVSTFDNSPLSIVDSPINDY
jgi:hypothetical protein